MRALEGSIEPVPGSFNPEREGIVITSDGERTVVFGGKVVWLQSIEEME